MQKVKRLVGAGGKYTVDGVEKTRWVPMGTMFKRDDGTFAIKLESIPVGPDFNGWISLYDFEEQPRQAAPAPAPAAPVQSVADDDLPFK